MALFQPFIQVGLTALPFFLWVTIVAMWIIALEFILYPMFVVFGSPKTDPNGIDYAFMAWTGVGCLLAGTFLFHGAVLKWPQQALAAMFP